MGSGLKDCNFMPGIKRFGEEVVKLLMKWLNRRGKRHSLTWGTFQKMLERFPLPEPRIKVKMFPITVK